MFPWASLISLAGQGVGYALNAVNARKQEQAEQAEYARQLAAEEAKANEDILSRSENKQLLAEYDRKAKKQVETARNVAAITGATPEYGVAVQEAVAEGRADLMGDMVAGASERKDKSDAAIEKIRQNKAASDLARMEAKNQSYANLIANSANSFSSLVGGYKTPASEQPASVDGDLDPDGNDVKLATTIAPPKNYTPIYNRMIAGILAPEESVEAAKKRVNSMSLRN